jgi:hypothetical protein
MSLLLFSCTHKKTQNCLTRENIKGSVKSITTRIWETNNINFEIEYWNPTSKEITSYDKNGNIKQLVHYNSNGVYDSVGLMEYKMVPRYDADSLPIEFYYYNPDGTFHSKTIYEFDNSGKEKYSKFYDKNENYLVDETKYIYKINYSNENYTVLHSYNYSSKSEYEMYIYYDKNGYETGGETFEIYQDTKTMSRKNLWTYKYKEFDEKGNWIKRVDFANDQPSSITVRDIEYY